MKWSFCVAAAAAIAVPAAAEAQDSNGIKAGDKLEITFADGTAPATATGSVVSGAAAPASRKKAKTAGQGDLF